MPTAGNDLSKGSAYNPIADGIRGNGRRIFGMKPCAEKNEVVRM